MPYRPPKPPGKSRIAKLQRLNDTLEAFRFKGGPVIKGENADCRDITFAEIVDYRINHPTAFVQDRIAYLLSKRRAVDAGTLDIRVDPIAGERWMHEELFICAACLWLLEGQDAVLWNPEGFDPKDAGPTDGWLLVEERQIIGGAKFSFDGNWEWQFVWIHPEYRHKGYVLKRLPQWIERYGSFVADQPNSHALALLKKAGYADKITITMPDYSKCRLY